MHTLATFAQFSDSLHHLTGFLFVLLTLLALWAVAEVLGRIFIAIDKRADHTPAPARKRAPEPVDHSQPTEEEAAAITAVVHCMFAHSARIVSIRASAADWAREGRRDHFASHRLRS